MKRSRLTFPNGFQLLSVFEIKFLKYSYHSIGEQRTFSSVTAMYVSLGELLAIEMTGL